MNIESIQQTLKEKVKYELKDFDIINIKKFSDYSELLIVELCQSLIEKENNLNKLKETAFVKHHLYIVEKNAMLPVEINELENQTKKELLRAHNIIIEYCTKETANKIDKALLFKLHENYQKCMPFWAQIEYFKKVINTKIDINEINKHIYNEENFKKICREIYKSYIKKQEKILKEIAK